MRYQFDWVQCLFSSLAIMCLAGTVVSMFVIPRQPWPVTFPLMWIGFFSLMMALARYEYHEKRGDR